MLKRDCAAISLSLAMAGCAAAPPPGHGLDPSTPRDADPQASGLVGVRPYPRPGDVCMLMGESDATREFLDDSALLIGCPEHARDAIGDRMDEGARVAARVGHWTLLSVPN